MIGSYQHMQARIPKAPGYTGPGMQMANATAHVKVVTCEEARCEWFLYGRDGIDEGAPFHHPQGVRCGDHKGCPDPNCPCPQRLTWEISVTGQWTGFRGHLVTDPTRPGRFIVQTSQGARATVEDEWWTRLSEGADTLQHIRTRGL